MLAAGSGAAADVGGGAALGAALEAEPAPLEADANAAEVEEEEVDADAHLFMSGAAARAGLVVTRPKPRLREVICRLNFHLLLLLRPESAMLSPVPWSPAYKEEYVLRQVRAAGGVKG